MGWGLSSRLAWCRVKFSMRLKFFGHRGHWKRWPEDVGVVLCFVESFAGPLAEPLVLLLLAFPAPRLPLPLGVPSILDWDGTAKAGPGWTLWTALCGEWAVATNCLWCGRRVICHHRMATGGWSLGFFEEAVELRCSGKVDGIFNFGLELRSFRRLRETQTARHNATGN